MYRFGDDWAKLCFALPGGGLGENSGATQHPRAGESAEACFTYAGVRDAPTQILMAIVGVLQIRPSGRSVLVAFLPLALQSDPGHIRLDDSERVQLAYLAHDGCDASGCYGRAEMPPALLDRMKRAKAIALMGVVDVTGRGLPFPLACCGFAAALEGAPVPAEAQDEDQHKLQDTIGRHFADFVR